MNVMKTGLRMILVFVMAVLVWWQQPIMDFAAGMPGPDTRLYVAIICNDDANVRNLLACDTSPNTRSRDGGTPLICAAACGNVSAVRTLLAAGADVNAQDDYGRTALMCAAQGDQFDVASLLITLGADTELTDTHGRTAVEYATAGGSRPGETRVATLLKPGRLRPGAPRGQDRGVDPGVRPALGPLASAVSPPRGSAAAQRRMAHP